MNYLVTIVRLIGNLCSCESEECKSGPASSVYGWLFGVGCFSVWSDSISVLFFFPSKDLCFCAAETATALWRVCLPRVTPYCLICLSLLSLSSYSWPRTRTAKRRRACALTWGVLTRSRSPGLREADPRLGEGGKFATAEAIYSSSLSCGLGLFSMNQWESHSFIPPSFVA